MEYRVWKSSPVNNACRLGLIQRYKRSYDLLYGLSLASDFPKNARVQMDRDFKKGTALTDDISNMNDIKICSKRLVEFLQKADVRHLEYLPLTIINHKEKVASTEYFVVNPIGPVDALDRKASDPVYSSIEEGTINTVARIVLDPRRLDPERKVFRLQGFFDEVLIEKELADAMSAARMVGPYFKELELFKR
jgi:hypothetical protein